MSVPTGHPLDLRGRQADKLLPGPIHKQKQTLTIEQKKRIGGTLEEGLPAKIIAR
jgi:hypothetical protein